MGFTYDLCVLYSDKNRTQRTYTMDRVFNIMTNRRDAKYLSVNRVSDSRIYNLPYTVRRVHSYTMMDEERNTGWSTYTSTAKKICPGVLVLSYSCGRVPLGSRVIYDLVDDNDMIACVIWELGTWTVRHATGFDVMIRCMVFFLSTWACLGFVLLSSQYPIWRSSQLANDILRCNNRTILKVEI